MRTTVDIDDPVLKELKKLQKTEKKSLGRLVSDLLAQALEQRKATKGKSKPGRWISRRMGARIDLEDKDAIYAALEQDALSGRVHRR